MLGNSGHLCRNERSSVAEIEQVREICQRAGLKATHQRLEILREILEARDHPSAEQIHERVRARMPTVSLDTVYRTLATFEERGAITRLRSFEGHIRYDPVRERHDHFVCTECKGIMDCRIPGADRLRIPSGASRLGEVTSLHVEARGVCRDCLKRRRKQSRRGG